MNQVAARVGTHMTKNIITDEELAAMAVQLGILHEGKSLPKEYRDFAVLIAYRCADIADRRDPDERPGAAIKAAFAVAPDKPAPGKSTK